MNGNRRRTIPGTLLAWAGGLISISCASAPPPPPPPVTVDREPSAAQREPPTEALPGWADVRSPARPPTPPPLPAIAPAVEWEPATPRQGTALAVRVLRPPGREQPSAITARLGGRTVRLGPGGSGWFGFAALPLDSAGVFELVVAYRQAGGPHEDRYLVRVRERTYPSARIRVGSRGEARPEVRERIRRDRERIWEALVSSGDEWLPSAPFEWPRPPEVTSPYGQRRVFNGRIHGRHMGLDLRGGRGAPVIAPAAGRVQLTGNFFYQGSAVYLDHGLGLVTAYFHLSDIVVTEGQRVESGQLLGRVGSTGRSTAPHLHWSAYVGGDNVDPASLVGLPWDGAVAASASATGEGR